jgi:hypothetical protein
VIEGKEKVLIDTVTKEKVTLDNAYGTTGIFQYQRLLKAYKLAPEAALEACSWGKFQVMGFNYASTGFSSVREFAKAMSHSDAEHLKIFLKFAKNNKRLSTGLKTKDFEEVAAGHNGDNWKGLNPEYASNLENFYNEYTKRNSNK